MATSQNVTAGALISATVKYNNFDDASRVYDIESNVDINSKIVSSFHGGSVRLRKTENEEASVEPAAMPTILADFNSYGNQSINFNTHGIDAEEAVAILSTVYAFMADVKNAVETKN